MSQKINGKNLHYDKTLPPFLARLRGQAPENSDSPNPMLARNRQHGKPRSGSEEAEDAPVVLDEDGNVLSGMKVGLDGIVQDLGQGSGKDAEPEAEGTGAGGEGTDGAASEAKGPEKSVEIGGGRKRKAGKVVGGGEEAEGEDDSSLKRKILGAKASVAESSSKTDKDKIGVVKTKKKAKKIKLSFGDDEEG